MSRATGRRHDLKAVARQAMIERGLLPDFPVAVLTEIEAIGQAASERDASILDPRNWTPIVAVPAPPFRGWRYLESSPGGEATSSHTATR